MLEANHGGIANPDDSLRLGASTITGSSTAAEFFAGTLDEVRVCQCVRNGNWLQAEYNTQNLPTSFVTTGVMQAAPVPVMTPVTVTITYTWDYGNRLTVIASPSLAASFLYDADGTRVKSVLGGVTTQTPTTWYNVSGTTPTKHILTPDGEMLATVEGSNAAATVSYIHTDHLTGSALTTNSAGSQTQLLDYHPFGTLRLNNQSSTFNEKRKFAGHEYDTETGLSYMQARYYDPGTGRFISQDPVHLSMGDGQQVRGLTGQSQQEVLFDPQGLNSYAYARNNPLKYIDSSGAWFETAFDIAMFGLSLKDYKASPGFWNGASVVADGASLFLPIPAIIGGIRHSNDAAQFLKGMNRTDNAAHAARGVINVPVDSKLRFSQTSVSGTFDSDGLFKGATRDSVIQGLKNGTINPGGMKINYLERNGFMVMENSRSASVLIEAGIPQSRWNLQLAKPKSDALGRIEAHLQHNNLPSTGTKSIKYRK